MNEAIAQAAERLGVDVERLLAETDIIRYSTTLAMNKLIERKGPKLGLLVTEGFEDTTLIGRGTQWADGIPVKHQRNIARIHRPEPLIPKEMIVGIKERVDSTGAVIRPLDEDDLLEEDPVPRRPGGPRVRGGAAVELPEPGPRAPDPGDHRTGVPRGLPRGHAGVPLLGHRAAHLRVPAHDDDRPQRVPAPVDVRGAVRDRGRAARAAVRAADDDDSQHGRHGQRASDLRGEHLQRRTRGRADGQLAHRPALRLPQRGHHRHGRNELRHRDGRRGQSALLPVHAGDRPVAGRRHDHRHALDRRWRRVDRPRQRPDRQPGGGGPRERRLDARPGGLQPGRDRGRR